jgi:lia operon protein LiaG
MKAPFAGCSNSTGAMALLAVSLAIVSPQAREINEERVLSPETVGEIQISMSSAPITVIRTDSGGDIRIHLYGNSMQEVHLGVEIKEMTVAVGARRAHKFPFPEALSLDVYLPGNYRKNLSIKTSSGHVRMELFTLDSFSLRTSSGGLEAKELSAGEINIISSSGKISLGKIAAKELEIKGSSSAVSIHDCAAQESRIETSSGGISLDKNDGNLTVKTSSGAVKVIRTRFEAQGIHVATTSGNVFMKLPDSAEFLIQAKTNSGRFQSEFPIVAISTVDRRCIVGRAGTKNNTLEIQTISGSIQVIKDSGASSEQAFSKAE